MQKNEKRYKEILSIRVFWLHLFIKGGIKDITPFYISNVDYL